MFSRILYLNAEATMYGAIFLLHLHRLLSAQRWLFLLLTARFRIRFTRVHSRAMYLSLRAKAFSALTAEEKALKGKGIQRLNGRGKGDQYVRVTIEVPKNLNAKQKNLIKEFENVTNEKNYAQRNSFFEKIKRMFNE